MEAARSPWRRPLLILALGLAATLYVAVLAELSQVDWEHCFDTLGKGVSDRPLPLGDALGTALGRLDLTGLLIALPMLVPFLILAGAAGVFRGREASTELHVAVGLLVLLVATAWIPSWHDCDRKGSGAFALPFGVALLMGLPAVMLAMLLRASRSRL